MNSDDFVITKKEAYERSKTEVEDDEIIRHRFPISKPSKSEENNFSLEYLYNHHHEVPAYDGILNMFVTYATKLPTAIVTSRWEIFRAKTTDWLMTNIIKKYGDQVWRQVRYTCYFNEYRKSSLAFKREQLSELMETYNIALMVEDHPSVIEWSKSKGIMTLVPCTGYKNLNGKDLR